MLYLISGTSRAGKTMIAERIAAEKSISYFSLDWLVMGFTNGIPEYGIHDLLFPDDIARRSWSFLKAMLETMLWSEVNYIIEGEALLPELVIELVKKHPNKIKICFIGYTDIDVNEKFEEIKKFSIGKKDWLSDKSDEYIIDHINNMVAHSEKIKKSCSESGIEYFDTSQDFKRTIEKAVIYLLS